MAVSFEAIFVRLRGYIRLLLEIITVGSVAVGGLYLFEPWLIYDSVNPLASQTMILYETFPDVGFHIYIIAGLVGYLILSKL